MAGKDFRIACQDGDLSLAQSYYDSDKTVINCPDQSGYTGLYWSLCNNNHTHVTQWLLTCPLLTLDRSDNNGYTALHHAAVHCQEREIVTNIASRMQSEWLNKKDNNGYTAVMGAVGWGTLQAVECLARVQGVLWSVGELQDYARKWLSGQKLDDMLDMLKKLEEERNEKMKLDDARLKKEQEMLLMKQKEAERKEREEEEERKYQEERKVRKEKRRIEKERKRKEEESLEEEKMQQQKEAKRKQIEEEQRKDQERMEEEKMQRQKEEEGAMRKYQVDEKTFTALCKKGAAEEVKECLGAKPELLNSLAGEPLRMAALARKIRVVEVLMEYKGLQVNLKGKNGMAALHIATTLNDPKLVQRLLNHPNIDVHLTNKKGWTPVELATKMGTIDSLKVLLEDDRVDLDVLDDDGKTLENLLGDLKFQLPPHEIAKARKLFQDARAMRDVTNWRNGMG